MFKKIIFIAGLLASFTTHALELKNYFNGWQGFRADFEQRVYSKNNKLQELSSGKLTIAMPSRFRLDYTKPYQQLYLADGKKLWFYDADLQQVTVSKQDKKLSQTPAMILSNPRQLDQHYHIKEMTNTDNAAAFELTPIKKGGQFEKIRLGFINNTLKHMELRDNFGRITFLEFSHLQKNPALSTKEFIFKAPAGVDIIKQ